MNFTFQAARARFAVVVARQRAEEAAEEAAKAKAAAAKAAAEAKASSPAGSPGQRSCCSCMCWWWRRWRAGRFTGRARAGGAGPRAGGGAQDHVCALPHPCRRLPGTPPTAPSAESACAAAPSIAQALAIRVTRRGTLAGRRLCEGRQRHGSLPRVGRGRRRQHCLPRRQPRRQETLERRANDIAT